MSSQQNNEIFLEKYRQYFETMRFNQQILNNVFKFYFVVIASVIGGFMGLVYKPIVQKCLDNPATCENKLVTGIPKFIIDATEPWKYLFLLVLFFVLLLGIILFLMILATRNNAVERTKILNSYMEDNKLKDEIDTKYSSFGLHYVYALGCSFFNSIIFVLIMMIGNITKLTVDKILDSPKIFCGHILGYRIGFILSIACQILLYWGILYYLLEKRKESYESIPFWCWMTIVTLCAMFLAGSIWNVYTFR